MCQLRTANFRSRFLRKVAGYTLIELLVVIVILGVLSTAGYAGYRDYSRRQYLVSWARQVEGLLRLAQEYSLAGRKETCTFDPAPHQYWRVTVYSNWWDDPARMEVRVSALCNWEEKDIGKSVVLPADIRISPLPIQDGFNFKFIGQGTDLAANYVLTIILTKGGVQVAGTPTHVITVTPAGEIKHEVQ